MIFKQAKAKAMNEEEINGNGDYAGFTPTPHERYEGTWDK